MIFRGLYLQWKHLFIHSKYFRYGKKSARAQPEPPTPKITENEQMSDIVFILDKMELILQAVSKLDKDGRHETVPADTKHRNSFLKIDRYADMFEISSRISGASSKTPHASASCR